MLISYTAKKSSNSSHLGGGGFYADNVGRPNLF